MSENMSGTRKELCPNCGGKGTIFKNSVWEFGVKVCKDCKGTGFIDVRLPPQQFRGQLRRQFK